MWSSDRNEIKGVSWFLISYHSVVLPQIVPAMFGMFVYKAAALVQVYRDNDDLKLVFPDSGEDSSDWDLCSSLSKVYDPSTLKPFHSRMRCFPKNLVGTAVCNSPLIWSTYVEFLENVPAEKNHPEGYSEMELHGFLKWVQAKLAGLSQTPCKEHDSCNSSIVSSLVEVLCDSVL